jgi:hypothetical protein
MMLYLRAQIIEKYPHIDVANAAVLLRFYIKY